MNLSEDNMKNILIVDDQPENLSILTALLTDHGYEVRQAINGKLALNTIKKNKPDLLLLDIRMPDMDGYEVCEIIKADQSTNDIPVIFLSVLEEPSDKTRAFSIGGVDYITKPFQEEEVIARVKTHLKLKSTQDQLRSSLNEKNVLLKEIHHRVKNNLQIIISFIRLQKNSNPNCGNADFLSNLENRIQVMAHIHEMLYQADNFTNINIGYLIKELINNLYSVYGIDYEIIKTDLNLTDVTLTLNQAIPSGLIINELITNAIKYAFPDNRKGILRISISQVDHNIIELIISDDGIGLADDLDLCNTNTLGLMLVTGWVNQLQGNIEVNRSQGTIFTIKFKKNELSH